MVFPIRGPAAAAAKAFIFIAAARGKSSENHHFLWVSEVTLGIFGVQFWGFSVLHCHGVFPSGDQQQQQPKPLQQQEGKPAKIHSSSKRKKQPKSSFSMGFRSYVRHFRGAILGLLCPSLPWCFLIRGPAAAAKAFIFIAAARGKSSENHHFLWVSEVTLGIFGMQFWGFSVLHCHGVFPSGTSSSSKSLCSSRRKSQPKFIAAARRKSSQNHHFLWVSEVTLGIFGVQFWGFSVLHCHGVFSSGDQQQQQKPSYS